MSEKQVRLYIAGEGDPELQSLIEIGLSEIGQSCLKTSVDVGASLLLDSLNDGEVAVVIKSV